MTLPVLDFRQEAEARQARDLPVQVLRLALQALRQRVQSVRALQGRPPDAVAPESAPQKDLRRPRHRLAQVDHQRVRTAFLHRVAQLQYGLPCPHRVQQALDAAVDPRLVRQSGIRLLPLRQVVPVLIPALQRAPVHEEPARRLRVARVQHAVRPVEHFPPVRRSPDRTAQPCLLQHGLSVPLRQLRHGFVLLLHADLRSRFLPREKKIS